jgi:hypothetical protein
MKKEKIVEMHQHITEKGIVFGKPHPADAVHKKESTQKAHETDRAWYLGNERWLEKMVSKG